MDLFFPSWRLVCCRKHRSDPDSASVCASDLCLAAPPHMASSLLKILRHRLGNEPPKGFEDDDLILVDASFYFIFGSSAAFSIDAVFSLFKPWHHTALPHRCFYASKMPLHQLTGVLASDGVPGSSCRDSVVFGSFSKGLSVSLLL